MGGPSPTQVRAGVAAQMHGTIDARTARDRCPAGTVDRRPGGRVGQLLPQPRRAVGLRADGVAESRQSGRHSGLGDSASDCRGAAPRPSQPEADEQQRRATTSVAFIAGPCRASRIEGQSAASSSSEEAAHAERAGQRQAGLHEVGDLLRADHHRHERRRSSSARAGRDGGRSCTADRRSCPARTPRSRRTSTARSTRLMMRPTATARRPSSANTPMRERQQLHLEEVGLHDRLHADVVVQGVDLGQVLAAVAGDDLVRVHVQGEPLGVLRRHQADAPQRQRRRRAAARRSPPAAGPAR